MSDLVFVCPRCDHETPTDGKGRFGSFPNCERCDEVMDLFTVSARENDKRLRTNCINCGKSLPLTHVCDSPWCPVSGSR